MGVETVIALMKRTLEAEGFNERVFVFDFNKLNEPSLPSMVILQLGRLGSDEISTYGTTFVRSWTIQADLYQALQDQSGEEAHTLLMQDVDLFISALEKKFHLGEGSSSDIRKVQVLNMTAPAVIEVEEGVQNWLRVTANVAVEETDTPGVGAE